MKNLILSLLLGPALLFAGVHAERPHQFNIKKKAYAFSSEFHIQSPDTYDGVVKKSALRLRANYDLSDKDGWQATGVKQILSLGSFYAWGTDLDIYDTRGVQIAMIDGQVVTTEEAKFVFYEYDEDGQPTRIATGYVDRGANGITVYAETNALVPIVQLERVFVPKAQDYWTVRVLDPTVIDDRVVRIFSALALDTQEAFFRDDVEINDKRTRR